MYSSDVGLVVALVWVHPLRTSPSGGGRDHHNWDISGALILLGDLDPNILGGGRERVGKYYYTSYIVQKVPRIQTVHVICSHFGHKRNFWESMTEKVAKNSLNKRNIC